MVNSPPLQRLPHQYGQWAPHRLLSINGVLEQPSLRFHAIYAHHSLLGVALRSIQFLVWTVLQWSCCQIFLLRRRQCHSAYAAPCFALQHFFHFHCHSSHWMMLQCYQGAARVARLRLAYVTSPPIALLSLGAVPFFPVIKRWGSSTSIGEYTAECEKKKDRLWSGHYFNSVTAKRSAWDPNKMIRRIF